MSVEPWTFEPFESHAETTWEVHDPNLARLVAVFFDGDEAAAYLRWRNGRQARARRAGGVA